MSPLFVLHVIRSCLRSNLESRLEVDTLAANASLDIGDDIVHGLRLVLRQPEALQNETIHVH